MDVRVLPRQHKWVIQDGRRIRQPDAVLRSISCGSVGVPLDHHAEEYMHCYAYTQRSAAQELGRRCGRLPVVEPPPLRARRHLPSRLGRRDSQVAEPSRSGTSFVPDFCGLGYHERPD
jgi:hypothetical protein